MKYFQFHCKMNLLEANRSLKHEADCNLLCFLCYKHSKNVWGQTLGYLERLGCLCLQISVVYRDSFVLIFALILTPKSS